MIYITGDNHGKFERIEEFCKQHNTTKQDVMIILGDVGLNYYGGWRDHHRKKKVAKLPITLFCIHGNHEERPWLASSSYVSKLWCDGQVFYEPEFPNILFPVDGAVFNFGGVHAIVIGGAYSVDKYHRLECGYNWFQSEQPDDATKQYVESVLEWNDQQIDVILSHTCPMNDRPVDCFLPMIDQSTVDTSTEEWLQKICDQVVYGRWYAGHYHVDRMTPNIRLMFNDVIQFPTKEEIYADCLRTRSKENLQHVR